MREIIEALIRTYRESLLLPDVGAVDPEAAQNAPGKGRGGHGTHGERGRMLRFGAEVPVCVEIERDLARLVMVAQRRVEAAQSPSARAAKGDRVSAARKAEKARILAAFGAPAIEVAYLNGWSEEGVRRARRQNGLDPDTGERVPTPRPITSRQLPESA